MVICFLLGENPGILKLLMNFLSLDLYNVKFISFVLTSGFTTLFVCSIFVFFFFPEVRDDSMEARKFVVERDLRTSARLMRDGQVGLGWNPP